MHMNQLIQVKEVYTYLSGRQLDLDRHIHAYMRVSMYEALKLLCHASVAFSRQLPASSCRRASGSDGGPAGAPRRGSPPGRAGGRARPRPGVARRSDSAASSGARGNVHWRAGRGAGPGQEPGLRGLGGAGGAGLDDRGTLRPSRLGGRIGPARDGSVPVRFREAQGVPRPGRGAPRLGP